MKGDHAEAGRAEPGLAAVLAAMGNPHRLRIIALLQQRKVVHVSQLAREVGLSRPLLYLHLRRLEEVGLVEGRLELSPDGKALKQYAVRPWRFVLTPATVARSVEQDGVEA
jgi:predicted transcriptional regulator